MGRLDLNRLPIIGRFRRARSAARVIAICDGLIPSVELCVIIPLRHLEGEGAITLEVYYETDLPPVALLYNADILLIMRSCSDCVVSIANELHGSTKIIYMTDDNILAILNDFPEENAIRRHYEHLNAKLNIPRILGMSDLTIVFSETMRQTFSSMCGRVVVSPAVSGVEASERVCLKKFRNLSGPDIKIGYAGSGTHGDDIAIIGDSLPRLLEKYPSLKIESIDQRIDSLVGHPRYEWISPVKGVGNFFDLLSSRMWTIGLSPLSESRFNKSKTDNKYRSYASVCVSGIYSNRAPFSGSVRDMSTGILVDDGPNNWYRALQTLVENPGLRHKIARRAWKDVRARYGRQVVTKFYNRVFSDLLH